MGIEEVKIHDVVGIGFGPSNLSLAVALDELEAKPGGRAIDAVFFERQEQLGWHRGMLLPSAKMQVSFLKDLVTFRNPGSPYSFISYLHAAGRLPAFTNRKDFFPSRREFHDYLNWVEAQFAKYVVYDSEVVSVLLPPVLSQGQGVEVDHLQLMVRQGGAAGTSRIVNARNIVLSTGLVPKMPDGIERSDRVWHSFEFMQKFQALDTSRVRSVAVVGAGQSAAELVRFAHDNFPNADVHAIFPSFGYSVADNTPLANQVFDPNSVDDYYYSSEKTKVAIWNYHQNTNYSVVDDELINDLYERRYEGELDGHTRLNFRNLSRAKAVETVGDKTRVTVEMLRAGTEDHLDVDLLVCATGYAPMDPGLVLGELESFCHRDEQGRLRVSRDYRVQTDPDIRCGIYLQGGTEHTHGLSSSLLSNIAVRSGEIAHSIMQIPVGPPSSIPSWDPVGTAGPV